MKRTLSTESKSELEALHLELFQKIPSNFLLKSREGSIEDLLRAEIEKKEKIDRKIWSPVSADLEVLNPEFCDSPQELKSKDLSLVEILVNMYWKTNDSLLEVVFKIQGKYLWINKPILEIKKIELVSKQEE